MKKNHSPYDLPRYNWGRYRDNYPRGNARAWAINDQDLDQDLYQNPDKERDDPRPEDQDAPYFTPLKPKKALAPDHDNPREKYDRKAQICEHDWVDRPYKKIIPRPYRKQFAYYYFSPYYDYTSPIITDPVMFAGTWRHCSKCREDELIKPQVRELDYYEREAHEHRVYLYEKSLGRYTDPPQEKRKRKKKAGRKRK